MSKIDTTGIKAGIVDIYSMLRKQQETVAAFRQTCDQLRSSNDFSNDYKAKRISELTSKLKEDTDSNFKNLDKDINAMLTTGQNNDDIFNLNNPELQASIQLINLVGNKMDPETQSRIVQSFVGDQQSLKILKSLFEANGMDTDEINKYIFSVEDYVNEINNKIYFIVHYPDVSNGNAQAVADALNKLANVCGIELTQQETSINTMGGVYSI